MNGDEKGFGAWCGGRRRKGSIVWDGAVRSGGRAGILPFPAVLPIDFLIITFWQPFTLWIPNLLSK